MESEANRPLDDAELEALRELGYPAVPELVEGLLTAARRGQDLAALAAAGSGREILAGLAAAARCDPEEPGVQALLLCPTREVAAEAAAAAGRLCSSIGLEALLWPPSRPGAPGPGSTEPPFARVVSGRPTEILAAVRAGHLGLSALRLFVVEGREELERLEQWPAAEAILDTLESETQKIVFAERWDAGFAELVERQLHRARRWPPELVDRDGGGEAAAQGEGAVAYGLAVGASDRLDLLAVGLHTAAERTTSELALVRCPSRTSAHRAAAGLAARGFAISGEQGGAGVAVSWGADEPPAEGTVAFLGLPGSLAEMRRWLGPAAFRIVVAEPSELPQLRILTARAGWPHAPLPEPPPPADDVELFRARLRAKLGRGGEGADLLVLAPLLEEFGAARVAAALAGMLRGEELAKAPGEPAGEEAPERATAGRASEPGVRPAWTKLFLNVGKRDGVSPGDLVGAITGETAAVGAQLGKIEIRNSFSLVDVDSLVAEDVIRQIRGSRIRGRDVVAKVAREN